MKTYQHLRAWNDPDGNPQRLWILYELETYASGERSYWRTVAVVDEGYGDPPDSWRSIPELPSVDISRSRYHALIRAAKASGTFEYSS